MGRTTTPSPRRRGTTVTSDPWAAFQIFPTSQAGERIFVIRKFYSNDHVIKLGHLQALPGDAHLADAARAYLINPHGIGMDVKIILAVRPDPFDPHIVDIALKDRFLGSQAEFL